jgi:hypothetical protein
VWYHALLFLSVLPAIAGCGGNVVVDLQESDVPTSSGGAPVAEPDASVFCDGFCKIVQDSTNRSCGDYGPCFGHCKVSLEDAAKIGCSQQEVAIYMCLAVTFGPDLGCGSAECDDELSAYLDCEDAAEDGGN